MTKKWVIKTKIRLYNDIVVSTLLYGSETWPMTIANKKRLEAAHHRWLRRILYMSWRDKITNKSIRQRTGQEYIENIIRKRRLRWLVGLCTNIRIFKYPKELTYPIILRRRRIFIQTNNLSPNSIKIR